ncbi:MAG: DUF4255 domain-containing protein [Oscillospiraceae bacterium]|jgi:hypothetical protein|nr:DUF4255 domain-containing protein [Oscillospiraceae bacterium]
MADFSVVADTSAALLRLLRDNLCPDPVVSPESIALAAPTDKNVDFQLGLALYDFKELYEYRSTTPINGEDGFRTRPPKLLSLYYLLFVNSKAQIAAGAELEQRIFGRALQSLEDAGSLDISGQNPYLLPGEESAGITLLTHSFEDKTKIWSAMQTPYQMAVYFMVSPVALSSRVREPIARVTQTRLEAGIIASPGALVEG